MMMVEPDEIYNLAAQSHVGISFDTPEYTGDVTGLGTTRLLEALRTSKLPAKFYQASSSELFGKAVETPRTSKRLSTPGVRTGARRRMRFTSPKTTGKVTECLP